MNLIDKYTQAVGYNHRKRLGQFFTPPPIAKFMTAWVLAGSLRPSVYDPAFGLGAFLENAPYDCDFIGSDIDGKVLAFFDRCATRKPTSLSRSDYLLDFGKKHDNIVCNPPYLRFQKFLNRDAVSIAFKEKLDIRLSGYTNIASAFLVKSISELNPGGRLAYILPSEFMNAGYGALVKNWLIRDGHLDSVIEVECEHDAFEEVTTSVCIVLYDSSKKIGSVSFRKVATISEFSDVMERPPVCSIALTNLNANDKWAKYFIPIAERITPSRSKLQSLSNYGRFSRGIATGANGFFVLSKSDIKEKGIPEQDCRPCITKSQQLKNFVFTDDDFSRLSDANASVYLFSPGANPCKESLEYIKTGEKHGYNNGFITRHRKPWFKTEARDVSPLLLNVFSRSGYKVVRNYSSALSLTNFHCFYPNPVCREYVDWIFLYLQSRVGRKILSLSKRKYGNLLDKFEPNDLNSALVPTREFFDSISTDVLSSLMSAIKHGANIDSRLDSVFAPLLSGEDEECKNGNFSNTLYPVHRVQQLRLALEKKRKKSRAKIVSSSVKTKYKRKNTDG